MAERVDVAVIGAGPAGLAAAIAARERGAERVLIIERAEQLGGLLPQCIHNGFGLLYFEKDMTGPEYEKAFIDKAMALGVEARLETMVIDLDAERGITAVSRKHGYTKLKPGAVVLAMGCRERSRGAAGIPGTRPAGVLTAGTCQRFVNIEGYMPGSRYVIVGSGDVGMIMARRLTLEGAKVEAVVEIMPWPGGLIRNEVQCLHDFGIPLLLEHAVTFVHGEERVEGVTVSKVDAERRPVPGTEKFFPCDCLLVSAGLIPENELSRKAGVELDPVTGGPVVDQNRQTSVPGIFAGGNVVQVHDLVDWVSWEAEAAGRSAAAYADKGRLKAAAGVRVIPGMNIKYVVPQLISGKDDVTLHMRVERPGLKATVKVGDVLWKRYRSVRPSEMVILEVKGDALKEAGVKGELVVDCEIRGVIEMAPRETVICIGCPLGCRVTVLQDRKGNVTGFKGAECKQGQKYVLEELRNPVRTLTATVRTGDESYPLLPVRTSRPVLKVLLKPIMRETARVKVAPPVKAGDVVVKNVLKTKADLVATADWPGPGGEG